MTHRALLGSIERLFAIRSEHTKGNLPTWLAPTQAAILQSLLMIAYAYAVHRQFVAQGVRSELDITDTAVNNKIRQTETRKIPYMAIVGGRETEPNTLSVRRHGKGNVGLLTLSELA